MPAATPSIVLPAYALSGLVSLGYQVIWLRLMVERFGSTQLSFALVIANFVAGLAAGALASPRLAPWLAGRLGLASPLRLYGAVEALVTIAAAATLLLLLAPPDLFGSFPYVLRDGIYRQVPALVAGRALAAALCVFVPCFFMGLSYPILCRAFADDARFPSALYAWNTLGAGLGVLLCQLVLLRWVGHHAGFVLLLLANGGLALAFLRAPRARGLLSPAPAAPASAGVRAVDPGIGAATLLACAVVGGLATGTLEADVLKRLRFTELRSDATLAFVSFWAVLGIFAASVLVRAWPRPSLAGLKGLAVLGLAWYLGAWHVAPDLESWLAGRVAFDPAVLPPDLPTGMSELYRRHSGPGILLLFLGAVLFLPFVAFAALLPFACDRLHQQGHHLGWAYGTNTAAFCLALVGFGWIAPKASLFYAVKLAALFLGLCTLFLASLPARGGPGRLRPVAALVATAAAAALLPRGFDPGFFPPDSLAATAPVRELRSDGATTTFVVEGHDGLHLYFDSFSMSATRLPDQRYMRLMAHVPLLAHPAPRRALVVCFGVGNTASAIAHHGDVEGIDVVDLSVEVFRTAPAFAASNLLVAEDPRVRLIHDDGRAFLARSRERYDLITSEPPPPRHEGVYRLYSRDYYEEVRQHLAPRGLATQWLTIRQMPPEAMALAIRSFLAVFPHALLYVGSQYDLVLMGSPSPIDLGGIERRFDDHARVKGDLRRLGVLSPTSLLARIVRMDADLRRDYGEGPVLRDARNDWSFVFFDETGLPRPRYAPGPVLAALARAEVASLDRLRRVLASPGLLRGYVPDFPLALLAGAEGREPDMRAFPGIDWERVHRATQAGHRAAQAGRLEEARDRLRESLEALPEQLHVLTSLARVEARLGEDASRLGTLSRLAALQPESAHAQVVLAEAAFAAGAIGMARQAIEAALPLAGGDPRVLALAARIRRGEAAGARP